MARPPLTYPLLCLLVALWPASSGAVVFTVDSTMDAWDASPGDGVCADASGACTLRAAVMEANALPGEDLVEVPAGTYPLSRTIWIDGWTDDGLTVSGAGAGATIVDAAGIPNPPYALVVEGARAGAPLVLSGLTITGTPGYAVVADWANVRLSRVAITGNDGGVEQSNAGLLRVEQSLIDGYLNSFGRCVGKTYCICVEMGRLSLENTTVQGIFIAECGNVTSIVNSTADSLYSLLAEAPTTLERSIVGSCFSYGNLTSRGHNIANDGSCNLTDPTDLPNTDPLLGPLQDNGGPTWTQALLPGSPAIDAIPPADCTFDDDGDPATPEVPLRRDQRGAARPQGAGCDIGSFEATACSDGIDNDGDGLVDYPADPGCRFATSTIERTQCQDGINNDYSTGIDFDGGASLNGGVPISTADPQCVGKPWRNTETSGSACGLGFEVTLAVLPLLLARRRREQSRDPVRR